MLEKLDMFGIDISIRFCKQILHKTSTGGIFTILIFSLIFLQIFLIIQQFVDKSNPQVLYQQSFTNLPERYNLTKSVFSLAFGLTDSKSQSYFDESVYTATLYLKVQQRIFNSTKNGYDIVSNDKKIKIVQCTSDHFVNPQTRDYYLQLDFKTLYCIDSEEKDIYIEGQFDGSKYARLQLMIDMCQNSTSSTQICKPQDQIDKKLTNNRLTFYYDDYSVVSRDRYNPFQAVGKVTFWVSGPTLYKNTNISFKNTYLYTDIGYMFKDIQQSIILSFSSDKESTSPRTSTRLYDCFISHEKNVVSEYHRQYMKIDRALSQIGGIYNLLFTIGCFLCKPISQIELNRKLLSSLFSFIDADDSDENNNNDQKSPRNQVQQQQLINLTQLETPTLNNDNQSYTLAQIKKSDPNLLNMSNVQGESNNLGEGNYLKKQQSSSKSKKNQIDQKRNKNRQQIPANSRNNKDNIIDNQIDRNSNFFIEQKNDQVDNSKYDSASKANQVTLNSMIKSQIGRSDEGRKKPQTLERNTLFNFFRKKNPSAQNDELMKNIYQIQQQFTESLKEIKFKSYEIFISSFSFLKCLRKRKHKVLKYGIQKLYQHIDIFYITTKLIELEKLKNLLLNEQQLKMFEFIPRPVLKYGDKRQTEIQGFNQMEGNKDWYEKMTQASKALKEIASSTSQISYIDKRLIEILLPKFKNLNLSRLIDTSKEYKENVDFISDPDIDNEKDNECSADKNQIRRSLPFKDKDFKITQTQIEQNELQISH